MTAEQQKQLKALMEEALKEATAKNPKNVTVINNGKGIMMGQYGDNAKQISDYLEKECEKDPVLKERMTLKEKKMENCMAYISSKAMEYAFCSMAGGTGGFVEDTIVFSWVKEYYMTDNLSVDKEPVKSTSKTSKKKASLEELFGLTPAQESADNEDAETSQETDDEDAETSQESDNEDAETSQETDDEDAETSQESADKDADKDAKTSQESADKDADKDAKTSQESDKKDAEKQSTSMPELKKKTKIKNDKGLPQLSLF